MKKSVITILLIIPLTLLIPNIGFGGGAESCQVTTGPYLPAYFGNITAEWQPNGDVIIYGRLQCGEKKCDDIIMRKKDRVVFVSNIDQVAFLGVLAWDLKWNIGTSFRLLGGCYGIQSASEPNYKSETVFTVDVVVMALH